MTTEINKYDGLFTPSGCLSSETLRRYGDSSLNTIEKKAIEKHLSETPEKPVMQHEEEELASKYLNFYDSVLVRTTAYPIPSWIIRHSQSIKKGADQRKLDLPGRLTISNEEGEGSSDYEITIILLTEKGCRFAFHNAHPARRRR